MKIFKVTLIFVGMFKKIKNLIFVGIFWERYCTISKGNTIFVKTYLKFIKM